MKPISIMLDGEAYTLEPTFEALSHIEQELQTGLLALAERLADGMITLQELAAIIRFCMAGDAPEHMEAALLRGGLVQTMEAAGALLAVAFAGTHHRLPRYGITRDELDQLAGKFA